VKAGSATAAASTYLPLARRACATLRSLHLVGAMASARADDAREARRFLALARQSGQQLGRDANHAWTDFGPTNVAVHDVSVAVELGDLQTAAAIAPRVDVRSLPVERRVRHALEVAKVYAMTGRDDEGLDTVLRAERDAPSRSGTTTSPEN
jgi:hypothetical protein